MKTDFTYIPIKETTETDWIGPLRQYITGVYGTSENFSEEIVTLNRLRQDVRGSATDQTGRDIVYRYYGQLELLDLRIPINEHGCHVSFTWTDAYTHVPTTQYSLAFEKASLLFNLAGIYSRIACDSDDIKVTYASFQAAAGIYLFIMENFLHAPSIDLNQDTVKALNKLMLAQAQEAFVERLMSDPNGKPSMIAKLAKGASNMFKIAAESLQGVYTAKQWGDRAWSQFAFVKSKYFLAVANEYQSNYSEASGKYGEAVAYLEAAVTALQEASKLPLPPVYQNFSSLLKTTTEAIKHKATTAEKDNDFIYHANVPPVATLNEITGLEAAKPTPMSDLYKNNDDITQLVGKDIFEKLIPLAVHEKSSLYSEEKAKLLRNEGEKIEVAEEELSSALEFLDLPASLRLLKNDGSLLSNDKNNDNHIDVPVIIKDWAVEVSASGSGQFVDLEKSRQSVYNIIKACEKLLSDEENEYQTMKSKFSSSWTQSPPQTINSGLISDIHKTKDTLALGASSDNKVRALLDPYEREIRLLRQGPNNAELANLFKNISRNVNTNNTSSVTNPTISLLDIDESEEDNLKNLLNEAENTLSKLNKLSKERKTIFQEFKDKVHSDDISSLLVLNRKVPDIEEKLFKAELEKFQPYQTRLEASIHHQKQLIKDLNITWRQVLSNETVKQKTNNREGIKAERNVLIERFRQAYNGWRDSLQGFKKGKDFYSENLTFAQSVYNNASEFVNNRREERSKLARQLQNESSDYSQENLRRQLSSLSTSDNLYSGPSEYSSSPQPTSSSQRSLGQIASSMSQQPYNPPSFSTSSSSPFSTAPQSSHNFSSTLPSWGNNSSPDVPPQLPPKPNSQGSFQQQQQAQFSSQPYATPSFYDPSMYGPQSSSPQQQYQQQPDRGQNSQPKFSYQSNWQYGQ